MLLLREEQLKHTKYIAPMTNDYIIKGDFDKKKRQIANTGSIKIRISSKLLFIFGSISCNFH